MKLIREGNSHVLSAYLVFTVSALFSRDLLCLQAEHHYPSFVAEKSKAQNLSNPPQVRAQNWGESRAGLRIHFCRSEILSPGEPER